MRFFVFFFVWFFTFRNFRLRASFIDGEVTGVLDFDLIHLNGLSLLDLVHVLVVHVVNLVGRACSKDEDSLEDGDDKLRVQGRLQEGVHLRLLDKLLELVKLYHFVSSAGQVVPDVGEFGSDDLVSDAANRDKQAEQGQQKASKMINVPCASNITAIIIFCEVGLVDV